jgi:hypothetical protein
MPEHKKQVFPNQAVWGPHFWFLLHTLAYYYPEHPTATTRRKYYDLIQNLPLFIPHDKIGNQFSAMLDRYPVTPYLDNRESFLRWVNFIHNKINHIIGKREFMLNESIREYETNYNMAAKLQYNTSLYPKLEIYLYMAVFAMLCIMVYYFYRQGGAFQA